MIMLPFSTFSKQPFRKIYKFSILKEILQEILNALLGSDDPTGH